MTRKAETRTTRAHARARAGRTRRGFAWSMIIALAVVSLSSSAWIPAIHAAFTGTTNSTASFSFASSFGGTNVVDTTTDVVDGTTTSVAALLAAKGADGKISLREAVTAANNSAASGPYTFTMIAGTFAPASGVNISSSLTLQGASTATTIISGGSTLRPFSSSGTNVTLKNLTVTNGSSSVNGAGVRVNSGNFTLDSVAISNNYCSAGASGGGISFSSSGALTVTNSTFDSNIASGNGGGGIYQTAGSLTVSNSTFSNDSGSAGASGGGISFSSSGALTVTNSTFDSNIASGNGGGGIYQTAGSLTVSNSTFSNDSGSAGAPGGGISFSSSGALTVTNSTFDSNIASGNGGGGIYQTAGSLTVTTSTISNNSGSAGAFGGGIEASAGVSSVVLTNVTVTGNTANNGGGGLWLAATTSTLTNATIVANSQSFSSGGGLYRSAGTVTIRNTIIANNTGGNCSGTITTAGYNLDSANTCSFSAGTDLRNTNPNLATLTNNGGPTNTIALNAGSLAINTGTTTSAPTTDQRAGPRVGATDIGAYEYGSTPP